MSLELLIVWSQLAMSLFKTREWWVVEIGDGDATADICGSGSLLVSNLNPEEPTKSQVVIGSYTGSLNIYSPQVSIFILWTYKNKIKLLLDFILFI